MNKELMQQIRDYHDPFYSEDRINALIFLKESSFSDLIGIEQTRDPNIPVLVFEPYANISMRIVENIRPHIMSIYNDNIQSMNRLRKIESTNIIDDDDFI